MRRFKPNFSSGRHVFDAAVPLSAGFVVTHWGGAGGGGGEIGGKGSSWHWSTEHNVH